MPTGGPHEAIDRLSRLAKSGRLTPEEYYAALGLVTGTPPPDMASVAAPAPLATPDLRPVTRPADMGLVPKLPPEEPTHVGRPLYKVGASYEGGHPRFPSGWRSRLVVWEDGVEFGKPKQGFFIAAHRVVSCEPKPMQMGLVRAVVAYDMVSLTSQVPMAFLTVELDSGRAILRFHVHGAISIPGESKNSWKLADAIGAMKALKRG